MASFSLPARVRIRYERPVEEWTEDTVERMMQKSIAYARLMDTARLRVRDGECLVIGMNIRFLAQIPMEGKDVIHQAQLEFLYVLPLSLAAHEFAPRFEEIIERDDTLVGMSEFDRHISNPPPKLLPLLQSVKATYLVWYAFYQILPKLHRHSLGQRIDTLFIEIMETIAAPSFLTREEKSPYVRLAIRKTDTLKVLLMVLWETKSIDTNKYGLLSLKVEEIGRMLGGWNGQLTKTQPRG